MSTNGTHHDTDEAIDTLYAWMPPQTPAPAPCPEACFSLTLKGHIDGHEALLTARGQTAAEFQANLAAIRGLLDAPAQAHLRASSTHEVPAVQGQGAGWCAVHQVQMKENHKDGRTWWSHQVDGHWCKGK